MQPAAERRKYDVSFKLKVIEVAKSSSNCVAARTFNVTEKMVGEWRKNWRKLKHIPKVICAKKKRSLVEVGE